MSETEGRPQRVVIDYQAEVGASATTATTGRATGRFFTQKCDSPLEGLIWHRLEPGETLEIAARSAVDVMTGVTPALQSKFERLHFRGAGRLTGPLVYRTASYEGVSKALATSSIMLWGIATPILLAVATQMGTVSIPKADMPIVLASLILFAAVQTVIVGHPWLSSGRKTVELPLPDFAVRNLEVEVIPSEVSA